MTEVEALRLAVGAAEAARRTAEACGEVVCEKSVGTTPETIAKFIEKTAPSAVRVGLESGLLSTWRWHGLLRRDRASRREASNILASSQGGASKTDRNWSVDTS